jgi:uncharacterized protein (DUF1330 family)
MKFYSIVIFDMADRAWTRPYVENVTGIVERYGGRYLSRTPRIEQLEGTLPVPQFVVIVEWPSREAAETFFASEEYRPYRESRIAGTTNSSILLMPGEDVAGLARVE